MKLKKLVALLLCAAVMLPLAACVKKPGGSENSSDTSSSESTAVTPAKDKDTSIVATDKSRKGPAVQDLMKGITKGKGVSKKPDSRFENAAASFALDLFRDEYKSGRKTLVSPLSVFTALAMTQNGAEDRTLSEMQKTLGGLDRDVLNAYMNAYLAELTGKDSALKCANSIWVDSKLDVKRAFLQKNADFYSAQAYKADFTSTRTVKEINSWVSKNTNGMIKKLVDEFDPLTVMVLMNALCLEAEWDDPYTDNCVREGTFKNANGNLVKAEYMYSQETEYIETENATGFVKYYKGGKFAFVALLPNEGTSIDSYIASLTGKGFLGALNSRKNTQVNTQMPKFKCEYSNSLVNTLKKMGMGTAFDENKANFSSIADNSNGNIFIGEVIHKTFIEVAEKGTRAGAVTAVISEKSAAMPVEQPKEVRLTRPFVYAIIDTQTNLSLFIGAQTDI
ncbi:MAG TPA: serine protease [Ruminococcaceae bacterium]|nr:serine protease [Oscillospiraceae bacterium]